MSDKSGTTTQTILDEMTKRMDSNKAWVEQQINQFSHPEAAEDATAGVAPDHPSKPEVFEASETGCQPAHPARWLRALTVLSSLARRAFRRAKSD